MRLFRKRPDQNWVQCDGCLQWRKLPDGIDVTKLPDKWFCLLNPDPQFRSCKVEEEPEDSDDDQPSYRKTYKQQERENKKKQEQKLEQDEEEQYLDLETLDKQTKAFKRQHNNLTRQIHQVSANYPTSNLVHRGADRAEPTLRRSSNISQVASSPPSSDSPLVITNVCSLSAPSATLRGKRSQIVTPQSTPKRPRVNGFQSGTSDSPISVHIDSTDTDDTDDDIVILETSSTPKPKQPAGILRKVKQEKDDSDLTSKATAEAETSAAETCPPPAVASATTQTTAFEVKEEQQSQDQTEGNGETASRNDSNPDLPIEREVKQEQQSPNQTEGNGETASRNGSNPDLPIEREIKLERGDRVENQEGKTLSNGVAHMESDEGAGPSSSVQQYPNIDEVQKQQDKLVELMQETAQERDALKEQLKLLTSQLEDMQSRLQKQSQAKVKESSHQACQTDTQTDYKGLFERAKQKINDLIRDKEALLAANEGRRNPNCGQDEENDIEEISLKISRLVHELDERNKEREELRLQLDILKEEKSTLAVQCEELKLRMEQQKENAQSSARSPTSGTNTDASSCLIELRQNVGRLLVSRVPALDLAQVNFECNVIDEILEQVLAGSDFEFPG